VRSIFSLPISLNANWIFRITQLHPPKKYIVAARRVLLLLGVLPAWICAALLSICFQPFYLSETPEVITTLGIASLPNAQARTMEKLS